ncbi:uncharacterized protein LOC133904119 [Phragmites australis]|uniref:uncharacterized protein LOC133904119 n=1 Tax=Phragmites australis TaxID=29695 RepID=UPI002D79B14D|nr:uncharacterized protein LOC133904119 [Phragmites australis]
MTRTAAKTAAAASAAANAHSGVLNLDDANGSSLGFVETIQEEMVDLRSRVGGVEMQLSQVLEQLGSMQSILMKLPQVHSMSAGPVLTKPTEMDKSSGGEMDERSGKLHVEGNTDMLGGHVSSSFNSAYGMVFNEVPVRPVHLAQDSEGMHNQSENVFEKTQPMKPHPFASRFHTNTTYVPPHERMLDSRKHHIHYVQDKWSSKVTEPSFSLSISRPKLEFPSFHGDNPSGWTRQCEKYFDLASVPQDMWVSMATLHCAGRAENWWSGLRISSKQIKWFQFCQMVCNRFSEHSMYDVVEMLHSLTQDNSISNYIDKFEELMASMQRQHPALQEEYYVRCFVKGLKEQIKHYLKPHKPYTLDEAYWIAKDLEKAVLSRKQVAYVSSAHKSSFIPNNVSQKPTQQSTQNPKVDLQLKPDKLAPISVKPKEPSTCWKCAAPWTPRHKQKCKFYQPSAHAISLEPEEILCQDEEMDPQREETECALQTEPVLMHISQQALQGTTNNATFCLPVILGGKRGMALVDSGSTHSFMDVTFASKARCSIQHTAIQSVKVAGGGELHTGGYVQSYAYHIYKEKFHNPFQLLDLKSHDLILGCDWIFLHSPIAIDLKEH